MRLVVSWLLLLGLGSVALFRTSLSDRDQLEHSRQTDFARHPHQGSEISSKIRSLLLTWILLLLLGGAEFAVSFLPLGRSLRPLVIIPGVLMVAVVAVSFMEVGRGPTIVRGFAVAAIFWLIVLLGLGSLDALSRTDYQLPHVGVIDVTPGTRRLTEVSERRFGAELRSSDVTSRSAARIAAAIGVARMIPGTPNNAPKAV
jgi:hypothetical protein